MRMDFLRKLKLGLYAVSLAEIFVFGHLAGKNGKNIEMMLIALALIVINISVYAIMSKKRKIKEMNHGHAEKSGDI